VTKNIVQEDTFEMKITSQVTSKYTTVQKQKRKKPLGIADGGASTWTHGLDILTYTIGVCGLVTVRSQRQRTSDKSGLGFVQCTIQHPL
jgi:hypothetical protein